MLDSFTRANGAPGSNWSGSTAGYSIAGNALDVGAGGDLYWGAAPFGADQEVYVKYATIDPAGSEMDLLLKSQGKTGWGSGVVEVWYDPVNHRIQIWTFSTAQNWVQRGADIAVTLANGDQFGAVPGLQARSRYIETVRCSVRAI